jgi:methionyl-tRNA formyltransferase
VDEGLPVNIVFIGASKFGLRCLEACTEMPEVNVVGVVTAPRTFSISYRPSGVTNVLHADVAAFAKDQHIPVAMLAGSMSDPALLDVVTVWQPDAFIVAGWYHMIPKTWRALAPAYGLHASLLPDYSGGAPLVWAMINGETKTGISLFQMGDGVDSGPIAAQAEESIQNDDTIATLYARIEERGLALLRDALPAMANGTLTLRSQDESKRRTVPQRSPEDGRIDWNQDCAAIDRFIRAQTRPYPGAFSTFNGKPITIWAAQPHPQCQGAETGHVNQSADDCYSVTCGVGSIVLNQINYEQRTYTGPQLAELLGGGGERLGDSPSCCRSCELC